MKTLSSKNITQLIIAWGNGDKQAIHQLIPLIYDELHRQAARYMRRENSGHTLQTTALVNEVYCKLIDQKNVGWQNRAHFFGIAAQLMRRILIDHARRRLRKKRGGAEKKIVLDETSIVPQKQAGELIFLDEALIRLGQFDPRKSRIVEMKFFGGLTTEEIAEVEQLSTSTVEREWRKAKAWLHHAVENGEKENEAGTMEAD
jgi:RNA polymerase sigma factor (TIGR02999 family)